LYIFSHAEAHRGRTKRETEESRGEKLKKTQSKGAEGQSTNLREVEKILTQKINLMRNRQMVNDYQCELRVKIF